MRLFRFGLTAAAAIGAALAAAAPATASVQVFDLSGVTGNQGFTGTLGLDFTVNTSVTVDSLGAFTDGATPITVTLYDLGTSATVASATISAAPAIGLYTFDALGAPVTLAPGAYQLAASGYGAANQNYNPDEPGGTVQASFDTDNGALTQGGAYYNFTAGAIATTFDAFTTTYGAGNLTLASVAEPATLMILGASLAGLGLIRRARR